MLGTMESWMTAVMLGTISTGSSLMSLTARLLSSSSLRSLEVETVGRGSSMEVSLLGSFSYNLTAICYRKNDKYFLQEKCQIFPSFTCKLSKEFSQSVVSISLRLVPSLSISAYIPMGSFPIHSNFMMCILDLRCLARCPWILKAIIQSPHLNGLGLSVDGAPKVALMLTLLKCPTDRLCFCRWPFVRKLTAHASHLKGRSK